MKILFSCPSSHPAPRWVAHGLVERGHDVRFFTSFAVPGEKDPAGWPIGDRFRSEFRRRRLPVSLSSETVRNVAVVDEGLRILAERGQLSRLNTHFQRKVNAVVQARAIDHMEVNGKPDAIFATGSLSATISEYAYEQKIPLVLYLPQPVMRFVDTIAPGQSTTMSPDEKIGAGELMAASVFLASSRLVESSIRHEGLPRPIVRYPLGFPSPLTSSKPSAARARTSAQEPFRVLFVGRVSAQKGLSTLMSAIRELAESVNVELSAVTRDRSALTAIANDYGVGHLVNVLPSMERGDLFDFMRAHHCFALPSIFEGYGLVVVEALANGLPVVTTPYTAGGDLEIDGRAGTIVPALDSTLLAKALRELSRNPARNAFYSKNAESITVKLSWEHYAKTVAEMLELTLMETRF